MSTPDSDDDFNFSTLTKLLSRYRWLVALCTVLAGVVAGVQAFTRPPYFRAEVVVTDVREHGAGNLGSLASELGGLASIAGVNIGAGGGSTPGQEFAAVLESHHLAEEFIKRNGLLPILLKKSSKPPTVWLAVKEFTESVISIRKDQRKGITTIGMQWTDPKVAAGWANAYVALANELIRAHALEESTRNIAYLNTQLAKYDSVDLRKVMYTLIESETKQLMVANGRTDYAFQIVDPAVPPELKSGPHRLLNTLIGLVVGGFLGLVSAYLVDLIRKARSSRATV
jgi:uncharacterized protein involved in exopolysaccharide biosynthesis